MNNISEKDFKNVNKSTKMIELRQSLDDLQKERENMFEDLNNINQKYEINMDTIDQKIVEKIR